MSEQATTSSKPMPPIAQSAATQAAGTGAHGLVARATSQADAADAAAGRHRLEACATGDAQEARHPVLWDSLQSICRLATTLRFNLQVFEKHNIPPTGGALLVSNHQSLLDPVLLAVQLRRRVSFLAKAELFENRYFGWLIRELNAFPVRRGESDVSAVREAIRRLKEGRILTMFPEGTRTRDGEIGPILPGIGMIVRRAGVPVVPAVIDGSFQAWPKGSKFPRPHPIRVLYGRPLDVENLRAAQIVSLIESTLRSMLAELRAKNGVSPRRH